MAMVSVYGALPPFASKWMSVPAIPVKHEDCQTGPAVDCRPICARLTSFWPSRELSYIGKSSGWSAWALHRHGQLLLVRHSRPRAIPFRLRNGAVFGARNDSEDVLTIEMGGRQLQASRLRGDGLYASAMAGGELARRKLTAHLAASRLSVRGKHARDELEMGRKRANRLVTSPFGVGGGCDGKERGAGDSSCARSPSSVQRRTSVGRTYSPQFRPFVRQSDPGCQ